MWENADAIFLALTSYYPGLIIIYSFSLSYNKNNFKKLGLYINGALNINRMTATSRVRGFVKAIFQ